MVWLIQLTQNLVQKNAQLQIIGRFLGSKSNQNYTFMFIKYTIFIYNVIMYVKSNLHMYNIDKLRQG